jgi:hypothetical protein
MNRRWFLIILIVAWSLVTWAEEYSGDGELPSQPEQNLKPPVQPEMSADSPDQQAQRPKKKSKGKDTREKEAEGTKAPNRFDTEVVIKSEYKLNGQSLEVDTD